MELICDFTNINGGVSKKPYKSLNLALHVKDNEQNVQINRSLLSKKYGIKDLVFMDQVHKTDIKVVKNANDFFSCDGIITNQKNLALIVLVADCIPILLYDKKNQAIGAIHAGRAGAFGNIAKKAFLAMRKNFNSNPLDTIALLGPSIGQCCYEISGDVLEYAKSNFPNYVKDNYLNIKEIVKFQLQELKISYKDKEICTSCSKEYFSYRRDKITGRFAGIIALKDKNA